MQIRRLIRSAASPPPPAGDYSIVLVGGVPSLRGPDGTIYPLEGGQAVVSANPPTSPADGLFWLNLQNGLLYAWAAALGVWISNFTSGVEVDPPPPPSDSPTIYIAPTGEAYTFAGEVYTIPT